MTRKDYIAMAAAIKKVTVSVTRNRLANKFAEIAKQDNPRFDRCKFLEACGVIAKARKDGLAMDACGCMPICLGACGSTATQRRGGLSREQYRGLPLKIRRSMRERGHGE